MDLQFIFLVSPYYWRVYKAKLNKYLLKKIKFGKNHPQLVG